MLPRSQSQTESSMLSNSTNKHFLKKCRICLYDGEIHIFGDNDISDDVMEYGKIKICKDDNLPQYLCEACNSLLEAAILFRKTANQSKEILKRSKYLQSDCEESHTDEEESDIKREYLEFNYSDSEIDTIGSIKRESEYDSTNYFASVSEVDTQDSVDKKKEIKGAIGVDYETFMVIVSDKDKEKVTQPEGEYSNSEFDSSIRFDYEEERPESSEKSQKTVQPHQIECEVCRTVVSKSSYSAHLKVHRDKYKEKFERKYSKVECEICFKKIGKSYLKIHQKIHNADEQAQRVIECAICEKTIRACYYEDHIKRVHQKIDSQNEHVILEIKPVPLPKYSKCPVCDKDIKESNYKSHVARHGGPVKRYICDKCGKEFKHPSAFKTHCLTHGSELKYKCQFCPYRGLHQGLLKVHVRTHTGDYNYKCTECPARFITKSNLSKHLQRHKGLCNFKCPTCSKAFYTKRDVEKHVENVHQPDKHHVCEYCGKAFGHRDNMLSHQLRVHKRDKIRKGRMPSYLKPQFMKQEDNDVST